MTDTEFVKFIEQLRSATLFQTWADLETAIYYCQKAAGELEAMRDELRACKEQSKASKPAAAAAPSAPPPSAKPTPKAKPVKRGMRSGRKLA